MSLLHCTLLLILVLALETWIKHTGNTLLPLPRCNVHRLIRNHRFTLDATVGSVGTLHLLLDMSRLAMMMVIHARVEIWIACLLLRVVGRRQLRLRGSLDI